MGRVIEKLDEEIRSLSPGQKVGLLRSLITELDAPIDLDVEQAWLEDAERRHRGFIEGKVRMKLISHRPWGDRRFSNTRSPGTLLTANCLTDSSTDKGTDWRGQKNREKLTSQTNCGVRKWITG